MSRSAVLAAVLALAATPAFAQPPAPPTFVPNAQALIGAGQRIDMNDPRIQQMLQAAMSGQNPDQIRAMAQSFAQTLPTGPGAPPAPPNGGFQQRGGDAGDQGQGRGRRGRGGFQGGQGGFQGQGGFPGQGGGRFQGQDGTQGRGGFNGVPVQPTVQALPVAPAAAPLPQDVALTRGLQSSVNVVFNPGAKDASVKLIETDAHGVEGVRYLKPGEIYRDGWKLSALTAREAVLAKGKKTLHVDITRGWPARPQAAIQPAIAVQPTPTPAFGGGRGGGRPGGPGGPGRGQGANNPFGLSNSQVGGTARPAFAPVAAPAPPVNMQNTLNTVRQMLAAQGDTAMLASMNNPGTSYRFSSSPSGATATVTTADGQSRTLDIPPGLVPGMPAPPTR